MWDDKLMYFLLCIHSNFESYFMMGVRQSVKYCMYDIFMTEQYSVIRRDVITLALGILTGMRSVKNTQK